MQGVSLRPTFADKPLNRDAIYWEHEGNAAIREGDWKLVRLGGEGAWELYHLSSDRTEQFDLADTHPDRVNDLAKKWTAWAERSNAAPNGLPKQKRINNNHANKKRAA